jgi:kynureninase
MSYHERLAQPLAEIVGADASEVIAMNSLTANLHFMLVSFYRPIANARPCCSSGTRFLRSLCG